MSWKDYMGTWFCQQVIEFYRKAFTYIHERGNLSYTMIRSHFKIKSLSFLTISRKHFLQRKNAFLKIFRWHVWKLNYYEERHFRYEIFFAKGQLISEAIFFGFNSSKKRTKYLQNFALANRADVFRPLFGRIKNKKKVLLKLTDL